MRARGLWLLAGALLALLGLQGCGGGSENTAATPQQCKSAESYLSAYNTLVKRGAAGDPSAIIDAKEKWDAEKTDFLKVAPEEVAAAVRTVDSINPGTTRQSRIDRRRKAQALVYDWMAEECDLRVPSD